MLTPIVEGIKNQYPELKIEILQPDGLMPILKFEKDYLVPVCEFLHTHQLHYFDYLACITGIDKGVEVNEMEISYNLCSIPFQKNICIKIAFERHPVNNKLPEVDSVSHIWRTANWHEREIFDLFGIRFRNHPDFRRILMPADWEGYPLRKDYTLQEYYHGIKAEY